jgi:hypothetical protein
VVAAYVVQRFDMKPAPGYDLNEWEKTLQDYFAMQKGPLPAVVKARV